MLILERTGTAKDSLTVRPEGNRRVSRRVELYNLDVVISVGYRCFVGIREPQRWGGDCPPGGRQESRRVCPVTYTPYGDLFRRELGFRVGR